MTPKIAVLIPCLNEELTIQKVVTDFKRELPDATIYVFDNDSDDQTKDLARDAGAEVHTELLRGKGYVVERMFRTVEADILIMVDGDDTYPVDCVHKLLDVVLSGEADMAVGSRMMAKGSTFKAVNWWGNRFYAKLINFIFGSNVSDILSGYRVMTRELVKNVPLFVQGFEIETVLTIKTLQRGYRIKEIPTPLGQRPQGSTSKISIFRDGLVILYSVFTLARDYKPLTVFGVAAITLLMLSMVMSAIALFNFAHGDSMLTLLFVLLTLGSGGSGLAASVVGLQLHTIDQRFKELEHLLKNRS